MADVIAKLKSGENTRGSRMVIKLPGYGTDRNFQYLANEFDEGHTPDVTALEAKYTSKLDDPSYYDA